MMDTGHWIFPKEFVLDDWFGFIYRITELDTNKEYLGKKQFFRLLRKTVKGRKNKKHVKLESDWKKYTGSSTELNAQIDLKGKENYKFEIISLHATKGSLYYGEVRAQVLEDVLRARLDDGTRKYYNKQIASVKFLPPAELLTESEMKIPYKLIL